jgi:hypothetical protein
VQHKELINRHAPFGKEVVVDTPIDVGKGDYLEAHVVCSNRRKVVVPKESAHFFRLLQANRHCFAGRRRLALLQIKGFPCLRVAKAQEQDITGLKSKILLFGAFLQLFRLNCMRAEGLVMNAMSLRIWQKESRQPGHCKQKPTRRIVQQNASTNYASLGPGSNAHLH